MNEVRIRTRLESDTPHLPDLAPFVGKEVEIVVREVVPGTITLRGGVTVIPGNGDWAAAAEAARELRESGGYDFDAWWRNRGHDSDPTTRPTS